MRVDDDERAFTNPRFQHFDDPALLCLVLDIQPEDGCNSSSDPFLGRMVLAPLARIDGLLDAI